MKNLLKVFSVAALATLSTPLLADNFYFGASVGQTKVDDLCDGLSVTSCDDTDTAYKIILGYQFNQNIALEGFYTDFGEVSAYNSNTTVGAEAEIDTFGLAVVGILPVSEQFDLFAKVGAHRWDSEAKGTLAGTTVLTDDDSGTDLLYGVGASFAFTDNVAIRAEWENYDSDDDVQVLSAGITYSF